MPNLSNLKTAIQSVIKTNGNNEITGAILQKSFTDFIEAVSVGYVFRGVATPTTNPGATLDANVFYIASQNGTYQYFGNYILVNKIVAFTNSGAGGAWQVHVLNMYSGDSHGLNSPTFMANKTRGNFNINEAQKRIELLNDGATIIVGGVNFSANARNISYGSDDDVYMIVANADVANSSNVPISIYNSSSIINFQYPALLGVFYQKSGKIEGFAINNDDVKVSGSYIYGSGTGSTPSNAQITLQQGGVTKGSFTLNQSSPVTINFDAAGSDGSAGLPTAMHCINHVRGGFNINTVAGRIEISGGMSVSGMNSGGNSVGATMAAGNYNFYNWAVENGQGGKWDIFVDLSNNSMYILGGSSIFSGTIVVPAYIGSFYMDTNNQIQGINIYNQDVKIDGSYFNVGGGAATNLFNPSAVIENTGISVMDGSLYGPNQDHAISGVIAGIVPDAIYTVLGFSNNHFILQMNMRFLDASNNPLKPILMNNTQDFSVPYTFPATSVKAPANATGFQFQIKQDKTQPPVLSNIQAYKQ